MTIHASRRVVVPQVVVLYAEALVVRVVNAVTQREFVRQAGTVC